MGVGWSSKVECIELVWTYGENGGEEELVKRTIRSEVRGAELRERQQIEWMDCVKRLLNKREMSDV